MTRANRPGHDRHEKLLVLPPYLESMTEGEVPPAAGILRAPFGYEAGSIPTRPILAGDGALKEPMGGLPHRPELPRLADRGPAGHGRGIAEPVRRSASSTHDPLLRPELMHSRGMIIPPLYEFITMVAVGNLSTFSFRRQSRRQCRLPGRVLARSSCAAVVDSRRPTDCIVHMARECSLL